MSNVVDLNVVTKLDIDPDRVLSKHIGQLDQVVICGFDKDGDEVFASSIADGADVLWLLERSKLKLLRMVDG